uniref:Ig-like domain-containing protein n=1 Tax=Podarcis muralis TaxID=64176 RepID=A0A670I7J1_PODMU
MDYLAFFIVAVLQSYQREHVDSTVKLASAMTLECVFPKAANIVQMFWRKEERKENIAVFKLPDQLHISSRYKDRVSVTNDTSNIKSLVFNSTTGEDTGFYLCSFHTFPLGIWKKRIQVVQSGNFEPRNLSYRHMIAEPGANVNFTYGPDPETTLYQVKWKRIYTDHVDFIVQCDKSGTAVYASDSGMYSCSYIGTNVMEGINFLPQHLLTYIAIFLERKSPPLSSTPIPSNILFSTVVRVPDLKENFQASLTENA